MSALREEIETVKSRDPAARNVLEIILCYPGFHALSLHRLANFCWKHQLMLLARCVSQTARFLTGIDIHPGAQIGKRVFIDHGGGVVIGETTQIGDDVLMYQGVTLGGTSQDKGKRHPTIGNNVVIGSAAVVLGPITVGDDSRIGANSVVITSVPEGATVVGVPGRIVRNRQTPITDLRHGELPDPFTEAIKVILEEQDSLRSRLSDIEGVKAYSTKSKELSQKIKTVEDFFFNGGGI
ncbi:MAG: serine O-acetyltransferase [Chloroflexota bacterium]|nr:serine O-acetyltransferase [Chloroflexota bacterium]